VEWELYMAGIGGQGIQLMAKVLALAGMAEQRHAMVTAEYGYTMRGGSSLATVVLGNAPLRALPVIAQGRSALIMHHAFWDAPRKRLRPGSLLVADAAIAEQLPAMPEHTLITVPATRIAIDIGNPMVAGLALLSAYATITGLVHTESLVDAMKQVVPSYRRQHVETNERALREGASGCGDYRYPVDLDAAEFKGLAA
jgi:Pyruvate/2-oxoacid:ferredoxin oxidoreductase gamma subunit